ncbi:MAG: glycosyltransferase family 2 protein [Rhodospirillales bacterium]|nr:glycosyltransferase family 2 protein [Rhodospirillales bacterium]
MPPDTHDVSVIIPAYRAAGTIGRALASIAAQSVRPLEVIVIDDGSDDGTFEVAGSMAGDLEGIELKTFVQENAGAGAARNKGLDEASGTYIAFLDADDEWLPTKLERSMARIVEGGHVLVAHDFIQIEADGSETLIECARRYDDAHDVYSGLYRQGFIGTSTVVAKRAAIVAAGGFDETLATAQDFDLWLKILGDDGTSFSVFPETLTRYHVSPRSITTFTERRLACTLRIAQRHFAGLLERPGNALASLGFRVLAVHYEAVTAHLQAGRMFAAIKTALVLPWHLLSVSMNTPGSSKPAPNLLVAFIWLWVITGFGAYVYRFKHLGQAFISMVERL